MRGTSAEPYAICLLIAGAMCLLPFLVPYHQPPILSFYPEWLAAGLGACAALIALLRRGRTPAAFPVPARWLIGFATFLLIQPVATGQPYPQTNFLATLYVLLAALMMWLGAQLASALGAERVARVLAAFLLVGAVANALAGAIQYYGRPALLEDVVAQINGPRAFGNIAQANLYANYIALGQCALVFLWHRLRIRTPYAAPLAIFLAAASALSGSRGALIFAAWIALMGFLAARVRADAESRRLGGAAGFVALCMIAAHFGVPWMNEALHLGPDYGASDRGLLGLRGGEPRWEIFSLGARAFSTAPVFGLGIGQFAGAAFALGLDPHFTPSGEVLTSPHDLILHLLAETGLVGAALALSGLGVWCWRVASRYRSVAQPALWWFAVAAGVELLHSMIEFPFWSANFLAVTALLMGGIVSESPVGSMSGVARTAAVGFCALLIFALGALLRDYVRLDSTRITGSAVTLASAADTQRAAATLRGLAHGLLAPSAELWIVSGAPLDRADLGDKLAMSERVAAVWPSNAVIVRRAALLALDGNAGEARVQLERALRAFPHLRLRTIAILEEASAGEADALGPLLALARER